MSLFSTDVCSLPNFRASFEIKGEIGNEMKVDFKIKGRLVMRWKLALTKKKLGP